MITTDLLLAINKYVIEMFGGMKHGVKDHNLLESCVVQINQEVFGKVLYPTIEDKISWIVFSIIANHIFLDGNKRTGIATLEYLCKNNNILLNATDDDLINLALNIANSNIDREQVTEWIVVHKLPIK